MITDILSLYIKLLDTMASGSLDQIIKIAAEDLNQHIVVLDTSYTVLSSYPKGPIGDVYWDAQQEFGFVPEENLNMIFENKYPDATFQGVRYIDWGNVVYPRAVSSVQYDGRSLGHVSIYHTDDSVSRENIIAACECLDKLLKVFFLNSEGLYLASDTPVNALLMKIFMGQQVTPALLSHWEKAVGCRLVGKYLLVAFQSKNARFGKDRVILGRMSSIHRYVASAEINEYQYLLFYNITSVNYVSAICERLRIFLDDYKLPAGVSDTFSDLSDIQSYMYQCRKALNIGLELKKSSNIFHFKDLLSEIMLSYITDSVSSTNSTHPLLKALKDSDDQNGTQYFETLITYLNCMCDSALTAKNLNIHRNTLLYRINHIRENYGCSFDDMKLMKALALSAYVCTFRNECPVCKISQDDE